MNTILNTDKTNNSQNLIKLLIIKHNRFTASKLSVMIFMGWAHVENTHMLQNLFDNEIVYFGLFFSFESFKSLFLFNERFNV